MNDAIIEKLRKILTLANDKAASPGEMEAAMGKARELAIRYNIELATISLQDSKAGPTALQIEKDQSLRISTKYARPYHPWIFNVIEQVFAVKVLTYSHYEARTKVIETIILIGEVMDVAMVKEIFPWLERLFPQAYNQAVKERRVLRTRPMENGFYIGLFQGIVKANKREEEKLQGSDRNQYALVVRSKEEAVAAKQAELFPKLKKAGRNQTQVDRDAWYVGQIEGQKISLRQLQSKEDNRQLA